MIPILYESDAAALNNNGLGRLRDMLEAVCVEERNGIYELDFTYPTTGAHYDQIICGRIVGATHDDGGDVQPFEIVSAERPVNGVVKFHAVHISYRQRQMVVAGQNINSLADAFTLLSNAAPSNPFTYWTDKTSTGYLAACDGTPITVRQVLGGVRGSILDAYGGEYEFDGYTVKLWGSRGQTRDFSVRYGVNLLDYNDAVDYADTFTSCTAYWKDEDGNIVKTTATLNETGYNGNDIRAVLDLSNKFENAPSTADLQAEALAYMRRNNTQAPAQNIKVDFVRLSDLDEFAEYQNLLTCKLCDSIKVIFAPYDVEAYFKIVRVEWDVLKGRYIKMELGELSQTLAGALGVGSSPQEGAGIVPADYITDYGKDNNGWSWREWNTGRVECWYRGTITLTQSDSASSGVNRKSTYFALPNNYALYNIMAQVSGFYSGEWYGAAGFHNANDGTTEPFTKVQVMAYRISAAPVNSAQNVNIYITGVKTQ